MIASKQAEPDIILDYREDRALYIYEYIVNDNKIIFSYRFNDWSDKTRNGYFILDNNTVYYNRDIPSKNGASKVIEHYRAHAYSHDELHKAIQFYLLEKTILMNNEVTQ